MKGGTAMGVLVLGVALLAMTAGCGPSGGGGGEAQPAATDIAPSGAGTDGPPPLPDSSPPATPALVPVTPAPGRRERVASWHLGGRSADGRRLLVDVAVGGPPCDAVTGLDVAETGAAVTVTVHAGRLTGADCPAGATGALGTVRLEVDLAEPLGARDLLGGIV